MEDVWNGMQGPASLVELAIEQKETNPDLVEHHFVICTILHAIFAFSLKSVKPMALFDTKVSIHPDSDFFQVQMLTKNVTMKKYFSIHTS